VHLLQLQLQKLVGDGSYSATFVFGMPNGAALTLPTVDIQLRIIAGAHGSFVVESDIFFLALLELQLQCTLVSTSSARWAAGSNGSLTVTLETVSVGAPLAAVDSAGAGIGLGCRVAAFIENTRFVQAITLEQLTSSLWTVQVSSSARDHKLQLAYLHLQVYSLAYLHCIALAL
jgi:hypothetical protein